MNDDANIDMVIPAVLFASVGTGKIKKKTKNIKFEDKIFKKHFFNSNFQLDNDAQRLVVW